MKSTIHMFLKMAPVFAGLIFFVSCKNDMETVKQITSLETYPTLSARNITIMESDSGYIKFKIKSDLLKAYQGANEPYVEFPNGLVARLFDKNQNEKSKISANYVIYKESDEKWIAKNNVEVIDAQGQIVNTEYLVWDQKKKKIYSDRFTKFTQEDAVIYGKGFEANDDLTNGHIKNPTGFFYVDEEEYKTNH